MRNTWKKPRNMTADSKLLLTVAIFCLALVAICYANSIPNEFLSDDYMLVALNPAIRTIAPLEYLSSPFWGENSNYGIYRPLVIFSFSLEYSAWKRWAPGFHLTNMVLHAINGVLVFVLVHSLMLSVPVAWAAAALFLIHPVHAESVASIAGRSELLSATFFFAAWLFFRRKQTVLCAIAFLLSLLSKENAIAFPIVIALDLWISEAGFKKSLEAWKRFILPGMSAALYLVLRFVVLGAIGMPQSSQYLGGTWTFLERELTAGRSFLRYFVLLLAPIEVAGNYDFNSVPLANARDWDAWLGILLILGSGAVALWFSRKEPAISFGILFFYAAMLPMSNWVISGGVLVAERYLYIPSVGAAIVAGTLWARIPAVQLRRLVAGGVMATAGLLCISHNYIWKNDFTYYSNMVRVVPNNTRARGGYGVALFKAQRFADAKVQFEAGLKIQRTASLLVGLAGQVIASEHSCRNARPLIDEALTAEPKNYFARWLLGECYDFEGQTIQAEQTYRRAVQDTPFPDSQLLFDWGLSLERIGQQAEADGVYRRAALIDPENANIQRKLTILQ
jgi:protein O-mannosyl-transferase